MFRVCIAIILGGLISLGLYGQVAAAPSESVSKKAQEQREPEPKYRMIVTGEAIDQEGTQLGFFKERNPFYAFTKFQASDGEIVVLKHASFKSVDESHRYFDFLVGKGVKVSRHGKRSQNSILSEYRAEIEFSYGFSHRYAVIWRNGTGVRAIEANSLAAALEFEKWYGPGTPN